MTKIVTNDLDHIGPGKLMAEKMTPDHLTDAKIIADSVSYEDHRLTTFEVTLHRFVLAELNTHRVFSRNSASSRAIPLIKQMRRVTKHLAEPVSMPAEQRGMQGGEEIEDAERARRFWRSAARDAIFHADSIGAIGVHKSVANRLLEPFMWHTVIISATSYGNFFKQRCSPLAQPEIRLAAEKMRALYRASVPKVLGPGEWHLPYVTEEDHEAFGGEDLIKISAARSARVSYLTHDGQRDPEKDIALYEKLVGADPMHASPLEHPATPASWNVNKVRIGEVDFTTPVLGNFVGWKQHRLDVEVEKGLVSYE